MVEHGSFCKHKPSIGQCRNHTSNAGCQATGSDVVAWASGLSPRVGASIVDRADKKVLGAGCREWIRTCAAGFMRTNWRTDANRER